MRNKNTINAKKETLLKEPFSITRLNRYRLCPALFKYAYLDKKPMPQSQLWSYGRDIHAALKEMTEKFFPKNRSANYQLPDFEEISDFVKQKRNLDYGKEVKQFVKVAEYLSDKTEIFAEKKLSAQIGDITVMGIVDNIHATIDGTVIILDYKTFFDTITEQEMRKDFQLSVYAYLVKKVIYNDLDINIKVAHWNWQYGYIRAVDWVDWGVKKEISDRISQILKAKKFPPTVNQYYCNEYSCPLFPKCKPKVISEEYGYCRDMENYWKNKKESQKKKMFEAFNTLGVEKIKRGDYVYSLSKKRSRKPDKKAVISILNSLVENSIITEEDKVNCLDINVKNLGKIGFEYPHKDGSVSDSKKEIPIYEEHTVPVIEAKKI